MTKGAGLASTASSGRDELSAMLAMTARVACDQMTAPAMKLLLDSVEHASSLPTTPGWERKAAAHAEFFRLLAGVAGDRAAAEPAGQVRFIRDLIRTAGPAANGMITGSRRRLLNRLRAGDADGAAREVEKHLRTLHYMWRLAGNSHTPLKGTNDEPAPRRP